MEIIYLIGREVEGNHNVNVPADRSRVSRVHAKLLWQNGEKVVLEDLDTPNGTYVNGRRIRKKVIQEGDEVWLGEPEKNSSFRLQLKPVFESCRKVELQQRTDFSEEFEDIKQAYLEYQTEVIKLKKKATQSSQMPKLLASSVPVVIGVVIWLISKDMTLRTLSVSIGTVLSGVVGFFTLGKSSSTNEKMTEEITELQIRFQPRYRCPKCGRQFPFTLHWRKLETDGCPYPNCDAVFVKQENQDQ